MKFYEIKLPSNRKFGFFFTFIFALAAVCFSLSTNIAWTYAFTVVSLIFFVITLVKSEALLPLNKLWMRLGVLLGVIVSPIVLGVIFFGLFAPIATLMRLSGRDELRLKLKNKATHWIARREPIKAQSFKNQF